MPPFLTTAFTCLIAEQRQTNDTVKAGVDIFPEIGGVLYAPTPKSYIESEQLLNPKAYLEFLYYISTNTFLKINCVKISSTCFAIALDSMTVPNSMLPCCP